MTLSESIQAILDDAALDEELDVRDSSRVEELEKLIDTSGWEALETEMLHVLATSERQDHCDAAAGFFWGATLDRRPLQVDRLIAHLYFRFPPGDNLAWSITSKLKGVGYLSDYDPLRDPAVVAGLDALRQRFSSQPKS